MLQKSNNGRKDEGTENLHIVNLIDLSNRNELELYYFLLCNLKRCVVNICNFV